MVALSGGSTIAGPVTERFVGNNDFQRRRGIQRKKNHLLHTTGLGYVGSSAPSYKCINSDEMRLFVFIVKPFFN